MSAITRTYTFTDGTTAYGSQVESEISNIVTTWNNHDAGTSRWTVTDATTIKKAGVVITPILQIQSASTSTATSSSSNVYADVTNLAVTITPNTITSKILIVSSVEVAAANAINSATRINLKLLRGASTLAAYENCFGTGGGTVNARTNHGTVSHIFLDSPASVAAQTYKYQIASQANNATAYVNENSGAATPISTIYAIEIGS